MEIFSKSLFNLEGIAPEKPHRATFEAKVGVIENVMWKFKKFDIAIRFHQYSNSIEKHFGQEKFSSEAFPVDSHVTEHPRPCVQLNYFKTRRINVMFNKRAAVFYRV